jgi:urea transport system permease protein
VLAPYWLFMLGGLFIAVTLLMPRGIIGTLKWGLDRRRAARSLAAEEGGDTEPDIEPLDAAPHAAE